MILRMDGNTPFIMNYPEAAALKEHCEERFNKFSNPCKSCIYRSRALASPLLTCMFSNCPRDWDLMRSS